MRRTLGFKYLAALACAAVLPLAAPANAEVIQVVASGRVGFISKSPGVTTNLTSESPINISFSFDTDQLTTTFSDATSIEYQLNPLNFSANFGDFVFPLAPNASFLTISNSEIDYGNGNFGRGIIQSFTFFGAFGASPFEFNGGSRISEIFLDSFIDITNRNLPSPSFSILNPSLTRDNSISFFARNVDRTQRASFLANPVSAAFVPEPTTWAMMILGFGLIGGAMRRRTARAKAALSAA